MEKEFVLSVITPDGKVAETVCDSVRFNIPDGEDGRVKSGSVGIRKGHLDSLMAVSAGKLSAHNGGAAVLECRVADGLAMVSGDRLDILTDSAEML